MVQVQDVDKGTPIKNCDRWRPQQKIMWAEIRKKTGRGKNWFTIGEMFADERCTGAVLDFLRTTKVGARMGPRELPPEPGGRGRREIHGLLSFAIFSLSFRSVSLSLSLSCSFSFFLLFFFFFSLSFP